jgi:hypothetical protein
VGAGLGAVAAQGSGWSRIGSAFAVGLLAAFAVVKLTSTCPVSQSGPEHLVWFMIAAIAIFDGTAALIGGTVLADWALGVWSLPLGLLVMAGETCDFRRWRRAQRNRVAAA